MNARLVRFGVIEIEGRRYEHDVVIDGGTVSRRRKGPSKQYRSPYGHTPLSADEHLPWNGVRLIIGTGANGALPVLPDVAHEALRRGVEVVTLRTKAACSLLSDIEPGDVYAVLHVTC
ncbi:MAG: hypothetical protein ACOYBY_00985 [Dermatophilaceae bacterium]